MKNNKIHQEQKQQLANIREKFNEWRLNMYLCVVVYVIIFFLSKWIIGLFVKPNVERWLNDNRLLTIFGVAFFLGWLFIADNIIASYLKTPLQRLGIKIENFLFDPNPEKNEKIKKWLLTKSQETNEMFKETFKKFGILAIPAILVNLIDNGKVYVYSPDSFNNLGQLKEGAKVLGIVAKGGSRNSEHELFYICYLIPILWATFGIIYLDRELRKIDKKIETSKINLIT